MVRLMGAGSSDHLLGMSIYDRIHQSFHEKIRQRIHLVIDERKTVELNNQLSLIRMMQSYVYRITGKHLVSYFTPSFSIFFETSVEEIRSSPISPGYGFDSRKKRPSYSHSGSLSGPWMG